jgi:hypothetical protein
MSDDLDAIVQLAEQAREKLKSIADDPNATDAVKLAAFECYEDVELLIAQHAIDDYQNRTALLTGLIVELGTITKDIQPDNPIAGVLTEIANISEKAGQLFAKEKKAEKEKNAPSSG